MSVPGSTSGVLRTIAGGLTAGLLAIAPGCASTQHPGYGDSEYRGVLIGSAGVAEEPQVVETQPARAPTRGPSEDFLAQADPPAHPATRPSLDWGDDWDQPPPRRTASAAGTPQQPPKQWSIVLATFASEAHQQAAATMAQQLPTVAGELGAARVHTTSSGSSVIYGNYENPSDPAAQRDLKWIKNLTIGELKIFPRAILSRISRQPSLSSLPPTALLSVRKRHPHVDPLYSLQVAVWGDFDSGLLTLAEIQRQAEAYARTLRAQGFEAYFHHDADRRLSVVTVGLFDYRAVDPRSGLYSEEVEAMSEKFPAHLVNGEPLNELIDRKQPRLGTRVQKPMLVNVPKL